MMNVFKMLYVIPGNCLSVEKAVELDAKRNVQTTFSSDVYRQPVLTEPEIKEPEIRRDSFRNTPHIIGATIADLGKIV
jgi:hypothetical protein